MKAACIEWSGCKNKLGYGRKSYKNKSVLVHRLIYAQANNLDVFSMIGVVMHKCDNPSCINIEHLVLGTHTDNSRDKVTKRRHTFGEEVWSNVLTEDDVRYIRARYIKGKNRFQPGNSQELATKFGVSIRTINNVANAQRFKHVT